jgi:hypothetical protein
MMRGKGEKEVSQRSPRRGEEGARLEEEEEEEEEGAQPPSAKLRLDGRQGGGAAAPPAGLTWPAPPDAPMGMEARGVVHPPSRVDRQLRRRREHRRKRPSGATTRVRRPSKPAAFKSVEASLRAIARGTRREGFTVYGLGGSELEGDSTGNASGGVYDLRFRWKRA